MIPEFPNYLMIQTISGCNASCGFCPYPYLKSRIEQIKMPADLFKKIIDECSGHKNIKVVMPYLMNEPLMDDRIAEKISYIKKNLPWVSSHILTNASLLDERKSGEIIESGLDWIGFSIHGIRPETIQKTMGISAFEPVRKILEFIKKSENNNKDVSKFVMVNFIKNQYISKEEESEIKKFWSDQGIKRISIYSHPISRAGNVPTLKAVHNYSIYGCNSIWANEMLHITSSGEAVLCCMDWKKEIVLGDVKTSTLKTIWGSDKYQDVRGQIKGLKSAQKSLICLRCECAQTEPASSSKSVTLAIMPPWGVERPPVGLAVISQVLVSAGFTVKILDINLSIYKDVEQDDKKYWDMDHTLYWRDPDFISSLIDKYPKIFAKIENDLKNDGSKIMAFSVPTNSMYLMLKSALEKIKQHNPEKIIVLGGVSVTVPEQRDELLGFLGKNNLIDALVLGEGEEAMLNLANRVSDNKSISDVENTLILQYGNRIETPIKKIEKLDSIPYPEYQGFPLKDYTKENSISMEWSRGCTGKCTFCGFKILSGYYKKKSPERIIEELCFYNRKLSKEYFSIVDSSINSDLNWIEKICDLIIQKNLKIKLTGLAVPRGDMDLKLLLKMKKAGFYRLEYGIESGSDKILKAMGKNFKSEDAKKTLALTKKSGIQNVAYFIVGFPTEDDIEFQKTLDFIKENNSNIDFVKSVNPLFLMSGSEIFSNPDKFNIKMPQENPDIYWSIGSSNNFDMRMDRVKSTHKLLKELGVAYTTEATALPEQKYDIALVTTPPWGIENPPVGLAYLAEYLKCHGYRCVVFDLNVEFYNAVGDNLKHLWHVENKNFWRDAEWFEILLSIFDREIERYVTKILQAGSPIIGFSVVDPKERITIEFIRRIKAKDHSRRIILGGPATLTAHARKIFVDQLDDKIDYFVMGEGEEALIDIMKKNCQGPIPGTIAIKESRELEYLKRPQIKDLDCIPYPSYQDFNLKCYPGNSLILEWSRGCISQCAFCINHQLIQGYRARSAEHIFNELKYHNDINKISYFTICDPLLNGNPETLDKLCSLIMENNLNINWTGEVIPRKDMDIALLKKMKEAGCFKLQIGLESGSNKVLKDMKKPYTAAIAENFLKKSSLSGIETEIFIMVGFPTEEESHFQETVDFVIRNQQYIDTIKSINTLHLIAGTEVYNDYSKYGISELPDKNWHYLWQTEKGNSYPARKERGERLLKLAKELGIKVMETNLNEGKQQQEQNPSVSNLKLLVNKLQDLPERKKELPPGAIMPRKRLSKAPYLAIILTLTILAELYLWALKKIRNMIIFPDS